MKVQPTRAQLLKAAHVFGLGGDIEGNPDRTDGLEKVILRCSESAAFITQTRLIRYDPFKIEYLMGESEIVLQNATTQPTLLVNWQKQIPTIGIKGASCLVKHMQIRDEQYCKYFDMHDATFAATELNGTPERIFLFVAAPRFDMERVIELLRTYRILEPLPEVVELLPKFCRT